MRTLSVFTACLLIAQLVAPAAIAEIFKTTDKQGRIIYTDQPAASDTKAKAVELRNINTLPAIAVSPETNSPQQQTAADTTYIIAIINPTSGTTLLPDQRNLNVAINLDQPLQADHSISYFVDNAMVQESSELNVTLNEPPRGEHQLHAAIKNKAGKILGESNSVTFIVMRPIVKQPPSRAK